MRFGFIAALGAEARCFRARSGKLASGDDYSVVVCGPGRERAARAAHELLGAGCDVVVSWGVAGATSALLSCGELVVSIDAVTGTGDTLHFDREPLARLEANSKLPPHTRGRVLTVADPLTSARDKRHAGERYDVVAVDMESTGIALVAHSAGKHFLAIRAVADDVDVNLPAVTLQGMDEHGRLRPDRILTALAAEPAQLPAVWKVGGYFRRAIRTLKGTARGLGRRAG